MESANQILFDRAEISDVVHRYATAVDTRNWPLFKSCFVEVVRVDFRGLEGIRSLTVDEWSDKVRLATSLFTATHHMSTNHVHQIKGNEGTCVSYMQATHFIENDRERDICTVFGYYTNELVRRRDGWRIHHCKLSVVGMSGNGELMARVAEAWR